MEGGEESHDWFHTAILLQQDQVASRAKASTEDGAEIKCVDENSATDLTPRNDLGNIREAVEVEEGKQQEMVAVPSNDQENVRPESVGTMASLPDDIRLLICWGSSTLKGWSTLDPELKPALFQRQCGLWIVLGLHGMVMLSTTYGNPAGCILAFAILLFFFQAIALHHQGLRNTYWLLTDCDLILVTRRVWFFPDWIRYISLDHIVSCGLSRCPPASRIYIDTPFPTNNDAQEHYAYAFGLAGSDWFKSAILQQRDQYR
jgi:hypothetical protein